MGTVGHMPKGDLLVARKVCRSDMEGALRAIFSGPSNSRRTAPMFVGLIERKAWARRPPHFTETACAAHWPFNSDAAACFGRREFSRLAKNTALK
jgi:hypothetical protein